MRRCWPKFDRRGTVVFVHPTSPPHADTLALGRPRPMLEFIFDSTRSASDLIFTGMLLRHPNIAWLFTHCGGALPLVTGRMELFRRAFPAAHRGAGRVDPTAGVPALVRPGGRALPAPGARAGRGLRQGQAVVRQRLLLDPGGRRAGAARRHRRPPRAAGRS
jgi:hypothetical protein